MPNIAANFISWTMVLTSLAKANPIVIDDTVRKNQESCVVAIDGSFANVSCSVTYHKLRPIKGKLYMSVPVFIPSSADPNSKDVHIVVRTKKTGEQAAPSDGEKPAN